MVKIILTSCLLRPLGYWSLCSLLPTPEVAERLEIVLVFPPAMAMSSKASYRGPSRTRDCHKLLGGSGDSMSYTTLPCSKQSMCCSFIPAHGH